MKRALALATAVAVALTSAGGAAADPPFGVQPDEPPKPGPMDDPYAEITSPKPLTWQEKARREALFREGKALIVKEQWKEASEKLHEGLLIRSDPEMLLWWGYAEERLGKLVNARRIYALARVEAITVKQTEFEQRAKLALESLDKKLPRIKLRLPEGVSARVYVDETVLKFVGEGIEVDPGTHTLQVSAQGRQDYRTTVIIRAEEVQTIDVLLPPVPAPPAVPPARPPAGCGCHIAADGTAGSLAAVLLGALAVARRRRAARR